MTATTKTHQPEYSVLQICPINLGWWLEYVSDDGDKFFGRPLCLAFVEAKSPEFTCRYTTALTQDGSVADDAVNFSGLIFSETDPNPAKSGEAVHG